MNKRFTIDSPARMLIFFCFAVLVYLFAMHARLGAELVDDGAFYLRYAENMLNGYFWVWNPGEAPVWGASAPLFPLVIAAVMKLGVEPVTAMLGTGIALGSAGLATVALILALRISPVAGIAFVVLSAFDSGITYFSGAGLETPLTFLLLAMGIWILLDEAPKEWFAGIIVGLLMVNKVDLAPTGALLLAAYWLKCGRFPAVALKLAVGLAAAWYGFAWIYFGAPVPNSFLTKLIYQANHPKSIDWTWFGGFVLLAGMHKWLVGLSVLAGALERRRLLPLGIFLGGTIAVHLIAYTIKYPFERYDWYCMPSVFALLVFAAIGVHAATELLAPHLTKVVGGARVYVPAVLLLAILGLYVRHEAEVSRRIKLFLSHQEFDRSEAGRWVAANTPKDFRVYTMWGNPAYYSQRFVLDGSFLNRKVENANLVQKYRPEILILQNNPGSNPGKLGFANYVGLGYRAVKVFYKTYSAGMDYFFMVFAREDVVGRVTNAGLPRELIPFVRRSQLGDKFGTLKPFAAGALFVHPGLNTPTSFDFDMASFAAVTGQTAVKLGLEMAPNVPEEAIKRGGANVRVKIMSGGKLLAETVVTVAYPYQLKLSVAGHPKLTVIVDNNGSPDTDWLIFSVI